MVKIAEKQKHRHPDILMTWRAIVKLSGKNNYLDVKMIIFEMK